jgi:two-component sensor histidine kinase
MFKEEIQSEPPPLDNYRLLFETMSEGFVLCEPIRDADGRLTDYRFLQANPAFLRGFRVGSDIVGRRLKELRPDATLAWFQNFEATIETGEPRRFQFHDRGQGRWYEVHCTRLTPQCFAQFYIDVTVVKRAEQHQAHLLDELNHRVKNNLTIVASLLRLQGRDAPLEVREHLEAAVSRLHAIADLHAELYRRRGHELVEMDHYLADLVSRLSRSLAGDRVKLVVESDRLQMDLDFAVQVGLVINELVTNALKYAYPEPEQGVVSISLSERPNSVCLTVSDAGQGLPPADQRRRGLGSRVVDSFVQQWGGTLQVQSDQGAKVTIEVPWRRPELPEPEPEPQAIL